MARAGAAMFLVSEKSDVGAPQHGGEGDQGQAGQRSRVAAFNFFYDRDAQALIFRAARAIVRLLYA